jgi:hypothetical protein
MEGLLSAAIAQEHSKLDHTMWRRKCHEGGMSDMEVESMARVDVAAEKGADAMTGKEVTGMGAAGLAVGVETEVARERLFSDVQRVTATQELLGAVQGEAVALIYDNYRSYFKFL